MVNKKIIPFFLILIILPFYSSAQIEMKENYSIGETLLVKVSGDFMQPISENNILFYRRHIPTAMEISLIKIGEDYYIYGQIPMEKIPDNYSIVLQGIKYFQGTQIVEENLFYNFSIGNETADFFVEPGAILANNDFSIIVQNLQNKEILLKVYFSNKTASSGGFFSLFGGETSKEFYSTPIGSGKTKTINLSTENLTSGLNTVRIESENLEYFLPVYVIKKKEQPKFSFEISKLNISMKTNSSESRKILIYNSGEETIKGISLSLSSSLKPYMNLSTDTIKELKADSIEEIILTFSPKEEAYVEGFVKAEMGEDTLVLPIYFNSFKETTQTFPIKNESSEKSKTCSELGGVPCGIKQNCSGVIIPAKDDLCCVDGKCTNKELSSTDKLVGWILLIGTIIVFMWFLLTKYYRTQNKINFSKVLQRR